MVKKVQDYTLLENIGKGSSGSVFRATHAAKPGEFAIKMIENQQLISNPKTYECLMNEVRVLSQIGVTENIVTFF
jgi:serine/threonine protein kinase